MDDRDWTILNVLAQNPNITKAAAKLFITQSALSKRLQMIEKEWNIKLFLRGRHGIIFTPEGELFAQKAAEMVEWNRRLREAVVNVSSGNQGTIKMGVSNSYARYVLPGLMQSYSMLYPNIGFDVSKMMSSEIVEQVNARELQMGVVSGEVEFSGIRKLVSVDRGCVISKKPISLRDLAELPQVRLPLAPLSNKFFDDWWKDWFASPPLVGMQVNQYSSCYEMVANGFGYAIVLIPIRALDSVDLYKIPLSKKNGEPLTRNTWAICRPEFYDIPLVHDWIDYLESCR